MEAVHIRLERLFPGASVIDTTSFSTALEAFDTSHREANPFDLILLDYHMPGGDGANGIAAFIRRVGTVPVAVMSGSATIDDAQAVIRVGAKGFIPKTLSTNHFFAAVNAVLSGGIYLPTEVLDGLIEALTIESEDTGRSDQISVFKESISALRPRERDVLKLVAAGRSNKEIGLELGLAEVTVKLHVRQILKRVGLRNRVEAAALATRAGFV